MSSILRNVQLLTWFNFFVDFRFYSPIAIIYFAQVTGSFALGMAIFSIVFITQSIFELPMGIVSDFIGRKKTIILGAICLTLGVLFYALGYGFIGLAIGAFFEGISRTFYSGNNEALLYESLKQVNQDNLYASASGKANSMFQLALGISALIGAGVAVYFPLQLLFWLSVVSQLVSVIISLFMVEPKIHSNKFDNNLRGHLGEAWAKFRENDKLKLLVISDALGHGIGEVVHEFRPAFVGMVWPAWAVGVYRTLTHAFGFIGFRLAGSFIQKFKLLKSLLISNLAGTSLQFISLGLANILSPILMAIPSLSFGIEKTSMTTLQQKEFSDKQRATMGSLSAMLGSIIFAILAVVIGWVADVYGVIVALLAGQILMLSVLYLHYRLFKMK